MAVEAPADEVHRVLSTAVDPAFYRTVYPDIGAAGMDPFRHYLVTGWREGRDPAPWFSTKAYLAANDDVREAGIEPLFHFLVKGAREGREAPPSEYARTYLDRTRGWPEPWSFEAYVAPAELPHSEAADRAIAAGEFDTAYYLTANPDIAQAGVDPLRHYMVTGWREARDPTAWFSTRDYLEGNPDVAALGQNPFVHYLRAGRAEGRPARYDLGFRFEVISRAAPVEARLAAAIAASEAVRAEPAKALAARIAEAAQHGLSDLHVTFSHDDYTAVVGGVQLSLRRESAAFAARRIDHLHVYPAAAWPLVRAKGEPGPLGVLLNGRRMGVFAPADVRKGLATALGDAKPRRRSFAVHSLLGHGVEDTVKLVEAVGAREGFFWLHDFASLCAGFHLLRDDVEDCAAPPPDSQACRICLYGPMRARHMAEHRKLLERLKPTVVAPSQTTLDFWRASGGATERAVVLPHATLTDRGPAPAHRRRALRVAFVGMPVPLKGWPVFRALAERHADDPRYEFLHLGGQPDPGAAAAFHPVVVTEARPAAMRQAIEAHEVDVALIWPLCRETFSFTAYEAAAAGAAVVTGPDSGNVAAFVGEMGLGQVLETEDALARAFETGDIRKLARGRRGARLYDLAFSGLSADLVRGRA